MNETRRTFFISPCRPDSPVIAAAADPSGRFSISPQMEKDATFFSKIARGTHGITFLIRRAGVRPGRTDQ